MTNLDIAHQRLYNQHIVPATFENPGDVVRWFGAAQAQDYRGALWALGLRGHYLRPVYLIEPGSKPGDCHRRRTLQQICWQLHDTTVLEILLLSLQKVVSR